MSWVNVGRIKGDTGSSGGSAYITLDSAHGIIYLGDDDHEYTITLASLKGAKGAIQNVTNQIGTITSAQTANLTLLGS